MLKGKKFDAFALYGGELHYMRNFSYFLFLAFFCRRTLLLAIITQHRVMESFPDTKWLDNSPLSS